MIGDNPSEPVLSQTRDLLEQPLHFYEPDVLPAAQPTVSKHYRKTQWFGRLLFYRHVINSTRCLTNSVKALKEQFSRWKWTLLLYDQISNCTKIIEHYVLAQHGLIANLLIYIYIYIYIYIKSDPTTAVSSTWCFQASDRLSKKMQINHSMNVVSLKETENSKL